MVFVSASGERAAAGYDAAPVAVAVLGEEGRVLRATQPLADRLALSDGWLGLPDGDLEAVLQSAAARVVTSVEGHAATLYAVVSQSEERFGLLTLGDAELPHPANGRHPLLDEPLDDADAVVWLKDLEGRYLRVNGRYEEQLGGASVDVVGLDDAQLGPERSLDAVRMQDDETPAHEPLELEYTVPAAEGRPAYAVLRFALRDGEGQPTAVCGVAAPLTQAAVARGECARLMRVERWSRANAAAITAELVEEWGYAYADSLAGTPGREDAFEWPELDALIAERDAAVVARDALEAQLAALRGELEEQTTALQGELDARVAALQGELAQAQAHAEQLAAKAEAAVEVPGPHWDGSGQRALAAALAGVQEWRTALERAVKAIGSEGGWDGVVAWSADGQRGAMSCAAVWLADPARAPGLETQLWQHRTDIAATEFGRARTRQAATCLLELGSAEDALLRGAAQAGMTSAVLVPVHDGTETVAMLGLLSSGATAPDGNLMLALEGVGLQLGTVAQLLVLAAAPRWRLGRA